MSRLAAISLSGAVQLRHVDGGPWYLFGRGGEAEGDREGERDEEAERDAFSAVGGGGREEIGCGCKSVVGEDNETCGEGEQPIDCDDDASS